MVLGIMKFSVQSYVVQCNTELKSFGTCRAVSSKAHIVPHVQIIEKESCFVNNLNSKL